MSARRRRRPSSSPPSPRATPRGTPRRRQVLSWECALEAYELHLRGRRASPRTLDGHLRDLRHLRRRFLTAPHLDPADVQVQDLRAYQLDLMSGLGSASRRPLSPGAVARITSTIRAFFAFLLDEERLPTSPALRLERPQVPDTGPGDLLTMQEFKRLLHAAPDTTRGLRDRTICEVLLGTGVRRAELCGLDLSDVDHEERLLRVRLGKGGKGRLLPLGPACYRALQRYLHDARPELVTRHPDGARALFLTSRGRRLHAVAVVRLLQALRQAARIKKRVTGHTFRRTYATGLLSNGANLRVLQLALGHASPSSLGPYLRLDVSELRRQVISRHPRERIDA